LSLEGFRSQVTSFLPVGADSAGALEWFWKRLSYERGDFADPNTFAKLRERLAALYAEQHTEGNYLYLSGDRTQVFFADCQQLGAAALSREGVREKTDATFAGIHVTPMRSHSAETLIQ
jgi:glucose-6-phosphate 1-dehydrogenase